MEHGDILSCSCCGKGIRNNEKENVSFNEAPCPHDEGFGWCVECMGDKRSKSFRKKLGWAGQTFCEARFDIMRKNISSANQKKWDTFKYEKKCSIIFRMIERGAMI